MDRNDDLVECFAEYKKRVGRVLPKFPVQVLQNWFYEHWVQAGEFIEYPLQKLSFRFKYVSYCELLAFAEEDRSPTQKNLEQLRSSSYQRDMAANPDWSMARLKEYQLIHGTWPVPPIVMDTLSLGSTKSVLGCPCLEPLHLIEGRRRVAVAIHYSEKAPVNGSYKVWLATMRSY